MRGFCLRVERGAASFARAALPALALLILLPASAGAIDRALCSDDGVNEVPPFAIGRDANNCLMLDPGNGDPAVPFQYEFFHGPGPGDTDLQEWGVWTDNKVDCDASKPGNQYCGYDLAFAEHGRCRTKGSGEYCTTLIWDAFLDNYAYQNMHGTDTYRGNAAAEYLLIKDSTFANNWRCDGGIWDGPNGIDCDGGDSSQHVDAMQIQRTPVNGGWLVFQDVNIVNSLKFHMLNQGQSDNGPNGSVVYQGVRFAQVREPVGLATNWVDDCLARGTAPNICQGTEWRQGYAAKDVWIVDSHGAILSLLTPGDKVVVVNSGCGYEGCNGTIQYENGWPHPIKGRGGPGVCPNGLMPGSCWDGSANCYCYTSLENALSDTRTSTSGLGDCPDCPHKPAPFLHLSGTGWETPPEGASSRPAAPVLLDEN